MMRNLHLFLTAVVLLVALNGDWTLSRAQTNKSSIAKPAAVSPKPDGKPSAANPPLFVDVTRAAGIDFHLNCGGLEKLYIVETQCGGSAAFDYDNDGWMDILLVDGSTIADYRAGKCHPPRLYHNNHDGTF